MQIKDFIKHVIKGALCSIIIAVILELIMAIVMTKFDLSQSVLNVSSVVVTCLSLVIGAVIAAKAHGNKGWMVGFAVGLIYYIAVYSVGIIFGADASLGMNELYRFIMAIGVGTLAGMIGINL